METWNIIPAISRQTGRTLTGVFFWLAVGLLQFVPKATIAGNTFDYDEVSVFVNVEGLGGKEMAGVIKDEILYLSVTDVFDFIRINYRHTFHSDSISGYFIQPQSTFLIDFSRHNILFQGKPVHLNADGLIRSGEVLYLKLPYFNEVFGLECTFNIRSLSVLLKSKTELPIVRELKLEQTRSNFKRYNRQFIADTTIGKTSPFLHFGMADWAVNATKLVNGSTYARFNLALGGVFAGGEIKAALTYTADQPFREKQQFYLWRYVNNDRKALRQVIAGKISTGSISSIFEPVIGVQFTNAPSSYRKSFGTYSWSGLIQPNWMADVYINNMLVDRVKSDALGFITYDIPLTFGSTEIRFQYYGPWGEDHSYTKVINVPYTFLPSKEFEYKVSAGVVEDSIGSLFAQAKLNYGLSDKITVGGGVEYLSSISATRSLPFVHAAVRATPHMLITGEYVFDVRYKGLLTYYLPKNIKIDLNYAKYNAAQELIRYNYAEERKAAVIIPVRRKNLGGYIQLTARQSSLGTTRYNNIEGLISMSHRRVSVNINSYAFFRSNRQSDVYSNFSAAFRLPGGFVFTPRAIYEYDKNRFISMNIGLEKHFSRFLSFSTAYEQRFDSDLRYLRAGFRYDFSFARMSSTVNYSQKATSLIQTASGSMIYSKKVDYLAFKERSNVGRGGLTFIGFLDLNGNNKRDHGEPKVKGLTLKENGGGSKKMRKDSTLIITGLEAYTYYFAKFEASGFENLAWKIKNPALNILVEPNQIKQVEIPVVVVGEAGGMIYRETNGERIGLGRIRVNFYDSNAVLVATTLSEDDGYFSYLGLEPGIYTAKVDGAQLSNLQLSVNKPSTSFMIRSTRDGDIIDELEFILQ